LPAETSPPHLRVAILVRGEAYRAFFHPKFELQSVKEQFRCTSPTVPVQVAVLRALMLNVVAPLEVFGGEVDVYLSLAGCVGHALANMSALHERLTSAFNATRVVWASIGARQQAQAVLVERGLEAILRSGRAYDFAVICRADLAVAAPLVASSADAALLRAAFVATSGDWLWCVPGPLLGGFAGALRGGCSARAQEDPEHATHLVRCSEEVAGLALGAGFTAVTHLPCAERRRHDLGSADSGAADAGPGQVGAGTEACPFPTIAGRVYAPLVLGDPPGDDPARALCEALRALGGAPCAGDELRALRCAAVREAAEAAAGGGGGNSGDFGNGSDGGGGNGSDGGDDPHSLELYGGPACRRAEAAAPASASTPTAAKSATEPQGLLWTLLALALALLLGSVFHECTPLAAEGGGGDGEGKGSGGSGEGLGGPWRCRVCGWANGGAGTADALRCTACGHPNDDDDEGSRAPRSSGAQKAPAAQRLHKAAALASVALLLLAEVELSTLHSEAVGRGQPGLASSGTVSGIAAGGQSLLGGTALEAAPGEQLRALRPATLWVYQDAEKLRWYRQFFEQLRGAAEALGVPFAGTSDAAELGNLAAAGDVVLLLGKADGGGFGSGCEGRVGRDLLAAVRRKALVAVFYETECYLEPQPRAEYLLHGEQPFAEVWTYSHETLRLLAPVAAPPLGAGDERKKRGRGVAPGTRTVLLAPGYSLGVDFRGHPGLGPLDYSRAVGTVAARPDLRLAALWGALPNASALVNVREAWDDDSWARLVANHHVAVDVHKPEGFMDANFFRLSPLLSTGMRVVSARCNAQDEASLSGLVEFGATGAMVEKVLLFLDEAKNETARAAAQQRIAAEYARRFNVTRELGAELKRLGFAVRD